MASSLMKLHDVFGDLQRFLGVVGNAEHDEHIGKAHDAQADFARLLGHFLDLRQGEFVDIDDVIQEPDGGLDRLRQLGIVDLVCVAVVVFSILARLMEARLQDS